MTGGARETKNRLTDILVTVNTPLTGGKRQTEISKTYDLPKKLVHIGKSRKLSFAQRENLERMRVRK